MGIQFNLDGTTTYIEEPSEQEVLQRRIVDFELNRERQFEELRRFRDRLLSECDWTVVPDSPLAVGIQSSWRTYRQSLRDLPNHSNAPDRFLISDWPLSPNQTEIPDLAKVYIAEISDPTGIGTTSWVGLGTDGEYVDYFPYPEPEPEVTPEPTPDPGE